MPTAPLFVADLATLKSRLRLSGLPPGGDGEALYDEALLRVRTGFYRRLGVSRVDVILAISFEEDAATADEVLRATANSAEVKWVYLALCDLMPSLFMDASGASTEVWNTEGAFRQGHPSSSRLQDLKNDLEADLAYLGGGTEEDAAGFRSATIDPDPAAPDPGDSLFDPRLIGLI